MSSASAETPVRTLFRALDDRDAAAATGVLSTAYRGVDATRSTLTVGVEEARAEIEAGLTAFGDATFIIHQRVVEPPRVSIFWSVEAVHQGAFLQIPATRRAVSVSGTSLFTVRADQITRGVHLWDLAGLLRDLGLLPDLPGGTAGPTFNAESQFA